MTAVYVMQEDGGPVKVGFSNDPFTRLKALKYGRAGRVRGAAAIHCEDADKRQLEAEAHRIMRAKRLEGEWFDLSPEEAVAAVMQAAKNLGLLVSSKPFPTEPEDIPGRTDWRFLSLNLPDSMIVKVDRWRGQQMPIPSRSEAIRRMIGHTLAKDGADVS